MIKDKLLQCHKTCGKTLERLHSESRKTLNMVLLVMTHPFSVERRTALKIQRDREKEAGLANDRCMHNLFGLLDRL
jgi:hypothetical protein